MRTLKLLFLVAAVFLASAACNSQKKENAADTAVKDTAVLDTAAVVRDTPIQDTSTLDDTVGHINP